MTGFLSWLQMEWHYSSLFEQQFICKVLRAAVALLTIKIGEVMEAANLLRDIPAQLPDEFLQTLVAADGVRIERIVSKGHCSPPGFWYDQDEAEWVLLVKGEARLRFAEPARVVHMTPGMHVTIAAHEKHRVEWTAPDIETIWVAVFFSAGNQ
jgi:cupin 2 domain-containing protein